MKNQKPIDDWGELNYDIEKDITTFRDGCHEVFYKIGILTDGIMYAHVKY